MFAGLFNKNLREYKKTISSILDTKDFTSQGLAQIKTALLASQLRQDQVNSIHKSFFQEMFAFFAKDRRFSIEEKNMMEKFISTFGLSLAELKFDHLEFSKGHLLWNLDQSILPKANVSGLHFNLKPNEYIAWAEPATLVSRKKITKQIKFSGLTGSIKIAPGFRYRVGAINLGKVTEEHILPKDDGTIWISNQRVGFEGQKTKMQVAIKDIHSVDLLFSDVVQLFKVKREAPYLIKLLNDPEVVCETIKVAIGLTVTHEENAS